MLKEVGYQEKIELLNLWMEEIIDAVKKDLKKEHLKIDRQFCRKYFLGKNSNLVSLKEMADAYRQDIKEGNVGLGEFIATRWLLKNTDIYGFFEGHLKEVTSDFDDLDTLPDDLANRLAEESIEQFGSKKTYIFSIFNSVVFPPKIYENLRTLAEQETEQKREKEQSKQRADSIELLQKRHQREVAALEDRYEKKLRGMEKKYLRDTETLKKQISALQKKVGCLQEKLEGSCQSE